ncbi:uncharacterized protein LOC121986974 [Zingiber officinale]|uniref:uncharacterized protein LOC121986974 n=1 Tax=Zingiber officinale TaxID=94328 RepID=UPI001C4C10AE|nr:uncharacterized protein LOC121986974 [Zingiber officinale]
MATYKLPDLQASQTSSSSIYLYDNGESTTDMIIVGWQVSPVLYETNYPRFFTYWTNNGNIKGCVNLECAGFVSTTNIYGPGSFIPQFSTYGGEQKYISILIARDSITGNWWITYNDELPLGYFPKELLSKMNDYANLVQMGGQVKSLSNVPSPPMGSGHPSNEGPNKAAYFIDIQFVDQSNNWFVLNPKSIFASVDIAGNLHGVIQTPYARFFFVTITGDLFDCVDMYKQPAFDHPLLENHTLQVKPSSLPKGVKLAKSKPASFYGFNDTCPSGTVLYAIIGTPPAQFYGVYAKMATYKLPDLQAGQTSTSSIYLFGDAKSPTNMIMAGWQVSPVIYETSYPRFFTYWTSDYSDKTGCFNLQCAGFVSTTNIYGPGSFIPQFSTYDGEQKYLSILITRDSKTGNWWITYNDELPLGYFPKELLPKMNDYADIVQMGGQVKTPVNVPSPPMGSGHPSNEGPNRAAYFIEIQFLDQSNNWFVLNPKSIVLGADISNYYNISDNHYVDDKYVFAYGGAGGFK